MLSAPGAQLDYVPQRAVDHIPMEMGDALKPVKTASVYQARNRVRFIPTSGQTFGVGASPANGSTSINIVISSPSDWIDMTSATLNFQLQFFYNATAATDTFGLDDLATSPFQRMRIYGGGTILHDTLYQNVLALAETYASTPFQVYKSKLGAEAYAWKFNNDNYGGAKNTPGVRAVAVGNPGGLIGGSTQVPKAVYDCSIPMSMFSPLFRMDKLFPLRNIGSLNIVLDMDPNVISNCCFATAGVVAGTQAVVLQGVEFRADLITVSPLVQAMYDQMCASAEGAPIIGYESPTGLVSSYAGSNGSASQKALVYPRVSPSLSHIVTVRRHAAPNQLPSSNGVYLPLSTFELTGYTAANSVNLLTSNFFAVGSKRVPQDPAPVAQAFGNTCDAFHARQGGFGSIIDAQNFCGVNNSGSYWDATAQAQVLAASFELTRDSDILGTGFNMGGQQLIQYLTTQEADNNNYNIYAFIFEHKYLRIANNTVMVETQL
jgi:hypothetical protein